MAPLDVRRVVLPTRVYADHTHAEGVAQSRDLVTDATHANHESRRAFQVDVALLARARVPPALALRLHVVGQPARQGEHVHHDMLTDVVVVYAAWIAHLHRMRD